jgi:hypothetical protein
MHIKILDIYTVFHKMYTKIYVASAGSSDATQLGKNYV